MNNLLFILIIILTIWLVAVSLLYIRQQKLFSSLTTGFSKQDLKTILQKISQNQKAIAEHAKKLEASIGTINNADKLHFQKLGFIRFNPYSDTGGDQSFSICLLDDHNNGMIITSLHGREQTRIYAKPIKDGKALDDFFEEEKQVLSQATSYKHTR